MSYRQSLPPGRGLFGRSARKFGAGGGFGTVYVPAVAQRFLRGFPTVTGFVRTVLFGMLKNLSGRSATAGGGSGERVPFAR
jgi:hypothetical protein